VEQALHRLLQAARGVRSLSGGRVEALQDRQAEPPQDDQRGVTPPDGEFTFKWHFEAFSV